MSSFKIVSLAMVCGLIIGCGAQLNAPGESRTAEVRSVAPEEEASWRAWQESTYASLFPKASLAGEPYLQLTSLGSHSPPMLEIASPDGTFLVTVKEILMTAANLPPHLASRYLAANAQYFFAVAELPTKTHELVGVNLIRPAPGAPFRVWLQRLQAPSTEVDDPIFGTVGTSTQMSSTRNYDVCTPNCEPDPATGYPDPNGKSADVTCVDDAYDAHHEARRRAYEEIKAAYEVCKREYRDGRNICRERYIIAAAAAGLATILGGIGGPVGLLAADAEFIRCMRQTDRDARQCKNDADEARQRANAAADRELAEQLPLCCTVACALPRGCVCPLSAVGEPHYVFNECQQGTAMNMCVVGRCQLLTSTGRPGTIAQCTFGQ